MKQKELCFLMLGSSRCCHSSVNNATYVKCSTINLLLKNNFYLGHLSVSLSVLTGGKGKIFIFLLEFKCFTVLC